jgi:hypothetical protein
MRYRECTVEEEKLMRRKKGGSNEETRGLKGEREKRRWKRSRKIMMKGRTKQREEEVEGRRR